MFWKYVIDVCIFFGGFIYAIISCLNPMICINFALPATKRLADKGWLTDAAAIRRKYRRTVIVWFFINLIVSALFVFFVPMKYAIPFGIGVLFCIVTSLPKTFCNAGNAQDYARFAAPYFKATSENDWEIIASIIVKEADY